MKMKMEADADGKRKYGLVQWAGGVQVGSGVEA